MNSQLLPNLTFYRNELASFKEASLLAVSKTKPSSDILEAYNLGQRDFGENKVQELLSKSLELSEACPEIRWHFIGSLQSNKINQLLQVPNLVSIHSIDSIKLLNKLLSKKLDRTIGLFLQINTSNEDEKSGFEEFEEVKQAVNQLLSAHSFTFQGLMTIGKIRTTDFAEDARICFEKLLQLQRDLITLYNIDKIELSMGMSSDYKIALEMGTQWIRIGTGLFGSREV